MNLITPRGSKKNKKNLVKKKYIIVLVCLVLITTGSIVLFFSPKKIVAASLVIQPYLPMQLDVVESKRYVLKNGDILANSLANQTTDKIGAYRAISALQEMIDLRYLKAGQVVEITYSLSDSEEVLQSVIISQNYRETVIALRQSNDRFRAIKSISHLEMREVLKEAVVSSSLYQAGLDVGVPENRLVEMFDLFAFSIDFQRDIYPGDRFQIIYEQYYDSRGKESGVGPTLAAKLVTRGEVHQAFSFIGDDSQREYYDEQGRGVKKALLLMPVQGGRLTSGYSARRNPVYGYSEFHPALDFAAPMGTPIMAAGDGIVEHRGWDPKGYGNYVTIKHYNGYVTLYAHMSRFAANARVGSRVRQGQTIGYIGSTGMSTGPHLHYEVRLNNKQYNPAVVVRNMSSGRVLKGEEKYRFEEEKDRLAEQLL